MTPVGRAQYRDNSTELLRDPQTNVCPHVPKRPLNQTTTARAETLATAGQARLRDARFRAPGGALRSNAWRGSVSFCAVTRRRVRVALPVAGVCAVLLISAGAAVAHTAAARAGLRPINQRALQALVSKTARELHVPGALVLLRTPQGKFTASYGTTRLGSRIRPEPYTHFRIASITKTMTSALILQLAQARQAAAQHSRLKIRRRRAQR